MRHIRTEALILHAKLSGEYHKYLTILTKDSGIIRCTAYGAYKSKSKMVTSTDPYRYAVLSLYHNPVKDSYKIVDVDVLNGFDRLRTNIQKILAAGYVTEIIQKTFAGGNNDTVFPLVRDALTMLDNGSESEVDYILIQFLLYYFTDLGVLYLGTECGNCGNDLIWSQPSFWTGVEGEFVCPQCNHPGDIAIQPGSKAYMAHSLAIPFERACRIKTDAVTLANTKGFLRAIAASALGREPLSPWQ